MHGAFSIISSTMASYSIQLVAQRAIAAASGSATCRQPPAGTWQHRKVAYRRPHDVLSQQQRQERARCWPRHRRRREAEGTQAALHVEAPSQPMDTAAAWALLNEFTKKEAAGLAQPLLATAQQRQRLRDALLVAAAAPEPSCGWSPAAEAPDLLLGVVASNIGFAVRSLRDYCHALGVRYMMPESRVPGIANAAAITGPVYVKYNPSRQLCYASRYDGRDRGVLVQLGQCQVGHLPLGLHDEAMAKPAPNMPKL